MMTINIHNTLQKNDLKETPLHKAVTNQNIEAVKFLVKQNITLEIKNINWGYTIALCIKFRKSRHREGFNSKSSKQYLDK